MNKAEADLTDEFQLDPPEFAVAQHGRCIHATVYLNSLSHIYVSYSLGASLCAHAAAEEDEGGRAAAQMGGWRD